MTFWPVTPVVYLEVRGDLEGLAKLESGLASGPLQPPASRPQRRFIPHVTLDQHIDPERIPAALAAMADFEGATTFERCTVLEYGAERRWEAIADVALGAPAVVGRGGVELELAVVERLDPPTAAWAAATWEAYSISQYGPGVAHLAPFAVVARERGDVVGVAEGECRGAVWRLARLIVAPERRGAGVGAQLLAAVERAALEAGAVRVRLETLAGGRVAAFYARHGYAAVATLPRWREERDFVVMERSVVPPAGDGAGGL